MYLHLTAATLLTVATVLYILEAEYGVVALAIGVGIEIAAWTLVVIAHKQAEGNVQQPRTSESIFREE